MTSLILSTATRYLTPLLLLFSFFVLFRGHNEPGGGFVGGLVAASAIVLYAIAHDVEKARRVIQAEPQRLIAVGLLVILISGLYAFVIGDPFMSGQWSTITLPVLGKLGTPLFFDIGVYFVVIGVTLMIIFSLMEA